MIYQIYNKSGEMTEAGRFDGVLPYTSVFGGLDTASYIEKMERLTKAPLPERPGCQVEFYDISRGVVVREGFVLFYGGSYHMGHAGGEQACFILQRAA